MPESVAVYFDYLCPFAWRGAEVAAEIAEPLDLRFEWFHFSLYQSNHHRDRQGDPRWQVWNERIDPLDESGTKGLLPFLASCAARRQGEVKHDAFRLGLLRARHRDRLPLTPDTVRTVARCAGLHLPQFENDLADPECRTVLAHEHHKGSARHVFGTPTFAFEDGHLAYFRIRDLPQDRSEAVQLFRDYRHLLVTYPYLETVKRPREPRN